MKRYLRILLTVLLCTVLVSALWACDKAKAPANPDVNTIRYADGFITWDAVEGATKYRIRINDGILLHEVPCQIKVDEMTGEEKRDYDRCERYLGEKASHGCVRIQRVKSPEGASIRWIWDNLSRQSSARSKVIIWDEQGRTLGYPDSDFSLYYNPKGGQNYHSSAWCKAVKERLLPLTAFSYGELEDKPYHKLTPCPACAPQLRTEAIDQLNAENHR